MEFLKMKHKMSELKKKKSLDQLNIWFKAED